VQGIVRAAAAAAAAVLVATLPGAAGLDRPAGANNDRVVRISEAPDTAVALRAARSQGSRVEAVDLRTGTRAVYAEPNGTMTAELNTRRYGRRARMARGPQWIPAWCGGRADGMVGPRVTVADLSFSGGGGAPLVHYYGAGVQSGGRGRWIELS
jgi:hypothetical protein